VQRVVVRALARCGENHSAPRRKETIADGFNAGYEVGNVVTRHCHHFHGTQVYEGEVESFVATHVSENVY
jgi:hypothetical protein